MALKTFDTSLLEGLSHGELISLVEEIIGGGITVNFSGKANATQIARKVRPRVVRRIKALSVGDQAAQAANLLIEGDNLQAMATLTGSLGRSISSWPTRRTTRATIGAITIAGKRIPTTLGSATSLGLTTGRATPNGCLHVAPAPDNAIDAQARWRAGHLHRLPGAVSAGRDAR